jgi:hypothetical protein
MKRTLLALVAFFIVSSALGQSPKPAGIRVTTWNLEWFPNGSAHDATQERQAPRVEAAADVLRPINPGIILPQEVRDYGACVRLGEAIQPGAYTVAICSAFKDRSKTAWVDTKLQFCPSFSASRMVGTLEIDKPRRSAPRFAFAWFKIRGADIGVYLVH